MTTASHPEASKDHILVSPRWLLIVRGFQALLSLVVFAMAATIISDVYWDAPGFALATAIITWIILAYIILSEKLPVLKPYYHAFAAVVLDGFMVILWLSAFATVAASRARFRFDTSVSSCYDDGSFVNSMTCSRKRADETGVLLFSTGQALLSATAGIGALVWLLFIASFAWLLKGYLAGRKDGRFPFTKNDDMESGNSYPMGMAGEQKQQHSVQSVNVSSTAQQTYTQQPATHGGYTAQPQYHSDYPQYPINQQAAEYVYSPSDVQAQSQHRSPASPAAELGGVR
jgi:hypothetical protein